MIIANALSLSGKLLSLADCFEEKKVALCFLTETWFQTSRELLENLDNLEQEHGIASLVRNRSTPARNGHQCGGVAIMSRSSTCKIKHFELQNPQDFEVLAATVKIAKVKTKFFVVAAYMPPNHTAARAAECVDYISDVISEGKRKFEDYNIVLSGDFNQWDIGSIILEHIELREVQHGPTRGDKKIGKTFTNFDRQIVESGTLPALQSEDGRCSDHLISYWATKFTRPPSETVTYTYRYYSRAGARSFKSWLAEVDWGPLYSPTLPTSCPTILMK